MVFDIDVKIADDGEMRWEQDGVLHRENGPALIRPCGTREWRINGWLHREDGPAVEYSNGEQEWWVHGRELTQEQYFGLYEPKKPKLGFIKKFAEDVYDFFQF